MVVTFDTLKAARRLQDEAGFDEVQANVLASVFAEIASESLASRADTAQGLAVLRRERIGPQDELEALGNQFKDFEARLRAELKAFEQRLYVRMGAMISGLAVFLTAVIGIATAILLANL